MGLLAFLFSHVWPHVLILPENKSIGPLAALGVQEVSNPQSPLSPCTAPEELVWQSLCHSPALNLPYMCLFKKIFKAPRNAIKTL